MPGPVERWLETFMCKQYADLFEAYGFKTLHSVCQLQSSTLHSMGIPPEHCDKILENVSVLRQSLVASSPEHMGSHESGLPYGLRHNLQSPHYSGSVGPGYPEPGYDHQMSGHGQSGSYSYHPSATYSSHQQYCSPGGQMNHNMYPSGESYSGSQAHYANQSHQDVYGQPLYNNRLHPGHSSWDDPMGMYSHPSRHVMGSSPPPASLMRSPPPPSPSSANSVGLPHYPRHVMDPLPPAAHHHHHHPHSWSQGQLLSSGSLGSPRGTPSPGMVHSSSNISSPSIAGCSPAHGKPFSPPPYSPHPPPAHQQSPAAYDYPPPAPIPSPSPSLGTPPTRHVADSPSDPLQSLQKMVLLDPQNGRNGTGQKQLQQQMSHEESSPNPQQLAVKLSPKFSSVEQLAAGSGSAPSPLSQSLTLQRTKLTDVSSPPSAASSVSVGKSSNIETPSPDDRTSDSVGGDASNEGSTVDESRPATALTSERTYVQQSAGYQKAAPSDTIPRPESSEDNNSSLDVVGHADTDSAPAGPGFAEAFGTRAARDGREKRMAVDERQNGYVSPAELGCCDKDPCVANAEGESVATSTVLANGILSENHLDECDVAVTADAMAISKDVLSLGDGKGLDVPQALSSPLRFEPLTARKNRRKQCLSSYASVRVSPPFAANNHYVSEAEFKVNGGAAEEQIELTELKPVARFIGGHGTLSAIGALEAVHKCHQMQDECLSASHVAAPRSVKIYQGATAARGVQLEGKPLRRRRKSLAADGSLAEGQMMAAMVRPCASDLSGLASPASVVMARPGAAHFERDVAAAAAARDVLLQHGGAGSMLGQVSVKSEIGSATVPAPCYEGVGPDGVGLVGGTMTLVDGGVVIKPRRGRPPGSKNKPKPPGYEKESKAGSKVKATEPAQVIEAPNQKQTDGVALGEAPAAVERKPTELKAAVAAARKLQELPLVPPPPAAAAARKPHGDAAGRPRGPYVHLAGGNREHPDSVTLVNTFSKDDEVDVKGAGRRKWPMADEGAALKRKIMTIGYSSTLSTHYDVFTKDKTWVCALCHRGSHYKGLGDLFGPYFGESASSHSDGAGGSRACDKPKAEAAETEEDCAEERSLLSRKVRAKRKRSELVEDFIKSTMAKKGKRARDLTKISVPSDDSNLPPPATPEQKRRNSVSTDVLGACVIGALATSSASSSPAGGDVDLWVHEECIVWAHGVYLLGPKIVGLNDAISEAATVVCSKCHEGGATVGCLQKGCSEQYHYICAIEKGCRFNDENFTVFCSKHRRKCESPST